MRNETSSSERSASGGVHGQIESFLQKAMEGLMGCHGPEVAAEQSGKSGHPVSLPGVSLWMAVLVGVLRGLGSMRAIWRLLAAGGWWKLPCYDVGDQAVYKRLEQEGWKPLAQLFERVSLLLAQWLQPALQAYHQQHCMLAPFASDVVALDAHVFGSSGQALTHFEAFQKRRCGVVTRQDDSPF